MQWVRLLERWRTLCPDYSLECHFLDVFSLLYIFAEMHTTVSAKNTLKNIVFGPKTNHLAIVFCVCESWELRGIVQGEWWYDPNFSVPPKFVCWNLILYVMIVRDGAFRRWLGHEGLMNGIGPLKKKPQTADLPLLPCEDTGRRHQI